MRNAASNLMWTGRAKNALTFAMAIMAALATSLLLLAVATRPAEAAFPGTNGKIVFSSNRAAPDGSTDYEIYVMNADGTRLTQLTDNRGLNDREPAFSPDGSKIAFSRDDRIWLMNADGSGEEPLIRAGSTSAVLGSNPTYSPDGPDGPKIAFEAPKERDIMVISADGSLTNLTNDAARDINPAWDPDGAEIAFARQSSLGATFDIHLMNADGSDLRNAQNPDDDRRGQDVNPAWSPNSSRIAFEDRYAKDDSDIVVREPGGGRSHLFDLIPSSIWFDFDCGCYHGTDTGIQANPAYSPDGSKIAFRRDHDIFVGPSNGRGTNLDGSGTPTRVTSGPAMDTEPDWGPLSFDLSVTQSDSPDPVKVNENLTYTLKVKNEGFDAAPDVVLTDRLPSGVTFVSASNGCSHALGKVTCKLGTVAGVSPRSPTGTMVRRTITVKPTAQDTITNTAMVKSTAATVKSTPVEVTYTANNSDRERTEVSLNRAPVADDDSYVTREDTPLSISAPGVLADDSDADGDTLRVARVVETTGGGTLTHRFNGSFTYTPNANFNGSDAFTYTATDGTAQSNETTVTIVVRAVNDAPNAQDDSAQTETNTPLDINVLSNDRDAERDEINITEVSDPANGTATLNTDGTVRYAPDTDVYGEPGRHYLGPDSLTYTVSDGNGGTDTATVNIQVEDTIAPEAPVITSPANNTTDTDGNITLSGTAEPYTIVKIFDGGNYVNGAYDLVFESGTWSVELTGVSEGSHSYTAQAEDLAGNISVASEALTVIVDNP